MLSFLQLLRSEKRGDLLWMNLASFRSPLLYGMLSALSIHFLSRNFPTEEIPLAIFWPFGIIDLENKICGSWRKVGAPPACTGENSTYTTAWGRTAWVLLYSFFRAIASNLQLAISGKPVFCCTLRRTPDVCTHGHLPPSLSCRVIGTCTAFLFFPDFVRGETTFPRTNRWETRCQESVDFEQKRVDFTKRLCNWTILCYVLSKFNNWFQLE